MNKKVYDIVHDVLNTELEALNSFKLRIGDEFVKAVELILNCKGRIIVSGMGKSGLVGKKIASTLASTGTPAFFLHPADAGHGDLGMIVSGDLMILISYSGETSELKAVLPVIRELKVPVIGFTGNKESTLANVSDVTIDISVEKEACPFGLVPSTSSTLTLVAGDALAISCLILKGFKEQDFAKLHPGGSLGMQLNMYVRDLMHTGSEIPFVKLNAKVKDALFSITAKGFGFTVVIDENEKAAGIITDGDIRRAIEKYTDILNLNAKELMTGKPKTISKDALVSEALRMMEESAITSLIILNETGKVDGIIHLHDLLGRGRVVYKE